VKWLLIIIALTAMILGLYLSSLHTLKQIEKLPLVEIEFDDEYLTIYNCSKRTSDACMEWCRNKAPENMLCAASCSLEMLDRCNRFYK